MIQRVEIFRNGGPTTIKIFIAIYICLSYDSLKLKYCIGCVDDACF